MSQPIPFAQRLIGAISGMIVWALWFVLVYSLTGIGCRAGWNHSTLALALIGWLGWMGYSSWRQAQAGASRGGQDALQRRRFMGMAMAWLAVIAALGTLLTALPMLMLDPCAL
jgi:hypothetical protein